jgi:hypothetical protein
MNQDGTRDLLWWRLRGWVPLGPRVAVSAFIIGLAAGIAGALLTSASLGLAAGAAAAITAGLLLGFRDLSPSETGPRPMRQLFTTSSILRGLALAGLPAALLLGFPVGLAAGLPAGATVGLAFGAAAGVGASAFWNRPGSGIDSLNAVVSFSPVASWQNGWAIGIAGGVTIGLTAGLSLGLAGALDGTLAIGLGVGFAVAFALWRTSAVIVGIPAGLVIGITGGTADAVAISLTRVHALGVPVGLTAGLAAGVALGALGGVMYVRTWPATLAFAQLTARWRTPLRLMSFLEDARARNVLRTVGPICQFRHARLQDRLAEQSLSLHPRIARAQSRTKATAGSPDVVRTNR